MFELRAVRNSSTFWLGNVEKPIKEMPEKWEKNQRSVLFQKRSPEGVSNIVNRSSKKSTEK